MGTINSNDLDANCAFEHFFGKSHSEAVALFQTNALFYQEDLQSMPAAALNFYAPALIEYLTSHRAKGDSDGASSFLHTVVWMFKTQRHIIAPETQTLLLAAADQISIAQTFYGAAPGIYGAFSDVNAEIKQHAESRA